MVNICAVAINDEMLDTVMEAMKSVKPVNEAITAPVLLLVEVMTKSIWYRKCAHCL
jgi:hypothetical protein